MEVSWELGANKVHLHYLEPSLALMEHFPEQKPTSCQPAFRHRTHQKAVVSLPRLRCLPPTAGGACCWAATRLAERQMRLTTAHARRPPTTHSRPGSQCFPRPCPLGLSSLIAVHTPAQGANASVSLPHAATDQKLWGSFFHWRAAGGGSVDSGLAADTWFPAPPCTRVLRGA